MTRCDKIESEGLDALVVAERDRAASRTSNPSSARSTELLSQGIGHLGTTGQGRVRRSAAAGGRHEVRLRSHSGHGRGRDAAGAARRSANPGRRAAGRSAARPPDLPTRAERRALERYDYLSALAAAPDRALSYPVADPVGGRVNSPSRWLLEQATRLRGEPSMPRTC